MLVTILHSRPIGTICTEWAVGHLPIGWQLERDPWKADVIISVLYDQILTPKMIETRRCYNFHPGILPAYRGSGAYSWVLINRERETGVTLHEIDCHIDSGPIIAVDRTLIFPNDTAETLFDRCMELLLGMFQRFFIRLLENNYDSVPNEGGRLYLRRNLEDAKDLTHIVRAFTFRNKENCYYQDASGTKHYLQLERSDDETDR